MKIEMDTEKTFGSLQRRMRGLRDRLVISQDKCNDTQDKDPQYSAERVERDCFHTLAPE
jgi:hypothetical protein